MNIIFERGENFIGGDVPKFSGSITASNSEEIAIRMYLKGENLEFANELSDLENKRCLEI